MPHFKYKAKKGPAEVVEGEMDAENEEAAISQLTGVGLIPIKITSGSGSDAATPVSAQVSPGPRGAEPPAEVKVSSSTSVPYQQINVFTRQFAILLKASVPLLKIFEVLQIQTQHKKFRAILKNIQESLRQGSSLSDALSVYPRIFSQVYVSMVHAGEVSGTLDQVLLRLAAFAEKESEIRSRVKSAMIYPVFLFTMGVLTVFILLTFVMPRLIGLFADLGTELPTPTRILIRISGFCQSYWIYMTASAGVTAAMLRTWGLPEPQRRALDKFFVKLPLLKHVIEKAEIAKFLRSIELLYEHGIPLFQAVAVSTKTVSNLAIRASLEAVPSYLEGGATLAKSLDAIPYISPFVSQMVSIGEESGQLTSAVAETANFYEQETEQVIKIATSLIEPIMILGVGVIVGFIVIAMLLPIFDIHVLAQ